MRKMEAATRLIAAARAQGAEDRLKIAAELTRLQIEAANNVGRGQPDDFKVPAVGVSADGQSSLEEMLGAHDEMDDYFQQKLDQGLIVAAPHPTLKGWFIFVPTNRKSG